MYANLSLSVVTTQHVSDRPCGRSARAGSGCRRRRRRTRPRRRQGRRADIVDALAYALSAEGYAVTNGEEALEAAQRAPYDLVVLDVLMPPALGHGGLPAPADAQHRPDRDADRERRRAGPRARTGDRRRRLRHEALLRRRARQPGPRDPAPAGLRAAGGRELGPGARRAPHRPASSRNGPSRSHRGHRSWSTSGRPRSSAPPARATFTSTTSVSGAAKSVAASTTRIPSNGRRGVSVTAGQPPAGTRSRATGPGRRRGAGA